MSLPKIEHIPYDRRSPSASDAYAEVCVMFRDLQNSISALNIQHQEIVIRQERIEKQTKGVVDAFNTMQSALKVFDLLGRLAKPLAVIAGAVITVAVAVALFTGDLLRMIKTMVR